MDEGGRGLQEGRRMGSGSGGGLTSHVSTGAGLASHVSGLVCPTPPLQWRTAGSAARWFRSKAVPQQHGPRCFLPGIVLSAVRSPPNPHPMLRAIKMHCEGGVCGVWPSCLVSGWYPLGMCGCTGDSNFLFSPSSETRAAWRAVVRHVRAGNVCVVAVGQASVLGGMVRQMCWVGGAQGTACSVLLS